jgi:ubiquinone/menaquinone biosynthesis C-methylase UbiE
VDSQGAMGQSTGSPEAYDAIYEGQTRGLTLSRIMRGVYGEDYPEEVEPFNFVTQRDLIRFAGYLSIGPGDTLVDLGCGRGGPGLWMARETGADLIAVDLSAVGIGHARQRIAGFGLEGRARFLVADLCATRLPDACCAAALSIDVVAMLPDKAAALAEAARILRPQGRFVLTAWESTEPGGIDYQLQLRQAGFAVEEWVERQDWRRCQLEVYERILKEEAALVEEMGEAAAGPIVDEAKRMPVRLPHLRHVVVVGERR